MADIPQTPMEQARSPMNAADSVMMRKTGRIQPGMTFGQYMENSYGISWDTPMEEAGQKLVGAMQNASPQGKMAALGGKAPSPPMGMNTSNQPASNPIPGLLQKIGGR